LRDSNLAGGNDGQNYKHRRGEGGGNSRSRSNYASNHDYALIRCRRAPGQLVR
jgi:hypothetical protein